MSLNKDDHRMEVDDEEEEEEEEEEYEEEEESSSGGGRGTGGWRSTAAAWGSTADDNNQGDDHGHHHSPSTTLTTTIDLEECLGKFASPDYIMEPGIFNQLKRYFQSGGSPEVVIELLSSNYNAFAQMANLMAEWIISAGASINEVRTMVEASLTHMIVKTFDPKKADTIFTEEGETPSWLTEMIEHPTWRSLVYRLAEEYPDCLMLNFTIKLISDAGFQGEITSISTASQQIEVFSRMVKTSILKILASNEDNVLKHMQHTAEMICHSEHTFVYSQVLLNVLLNEGGGDSSNNGGGNTAAPQQPTVVRNGHLIKRLCQEIVKQAHHKGHDVTAVVMSLNGSTQYPRACQALSAMLSRNALNPADITVLFKMYSSAQPNNDPPPVELIRAPQFLDLLIEALFRPGSRLNPEHKGKYMYLLAYAASVVDVFRRAVRQTLRQDELKATMAAVDKVHSICSAAKNHNEIITELQGLYQAIRYPVVSIGVLRWIEFTVTDPSYFKLQTEHTPIHIALLDEIAACHALLHSKVFDLVVNLLQSTLLDDLDVLVQLEMRKMLLDRLVNLLTRGHVVPVLKYVKQCWTRGDTDVSLIRYFVNEVLDVVGPPYSSEFVSLFLPMVESDEITGQHDPNAEHDPVAEFVVHCKALSISSSSTLSPTAAGPDGSTTADGGVIIVSSGGGGG